MVALDSVVEVTVNIKLIFLTVHSLGLCRGFSFVKKLCLDVRWDSRMCIETFIAIHGRTAMRHDLGHFIRHTSSDHFCEGKL